MENAEIIAKICTQIQTFIESYINQCKRTSIKTRGDNNNGVQYNNNVANVT